jgi:hypothetical protein
MVKDRLKLKMLWSSNECEKKTKVERISKSPSPALIRIKNEQLEK